MDTMSINACPGSHTYMFYVRSPRTCVCVLLCSYIGACLNTLHIYTHSNVGTSCMYFLYPQMYRMFHMSALPLYVEETEEVEEEDEPELYTHLYFWQVCV